LDRTVSNQILIFVLRFEYLHRGGEVSVDTKQLEIAFETIVRDKGYTGLILFLTMIRNY